MATPLVAPLPAVHLDDAGRMGMREGSKAVSEAANRLPSKPSGQDAGNDAQAEDTGQVRELSKAIDGVGHGDEDDHYPSNSEPEDEGSANANALKLSEKERIQNALFSA